jgi:DNA-binding NarL/FixJ family response regulator
MRPALALQDVLPAVIAVDPLHEERVGAAVSSPAIDARQQDENRPPRVLLVDDEEEVRAALRELLQDMGMAIVGEAADGEEAVPRVDEVRPEVVLMDLRMPKMDGLEASRAIKHRHPAVHIIILSAYDDPGLRRSADVAGATLYLVKGCRPWLIEQAIKSAAGLYRSGNRLEG